MSDKQCYFEEPWVGRCKEERIGVKPTDHWFDYSGMCCEKHSKEKCVVCGDQAFTRCQASIGLMCGRPLCTVCGKGEMCDAHAGHGPAKIVRELKDELAKVKAAMKVVGSVDGTVETDEYWVEPR